MQLTKQGPPLPQAQTQIQIQTHIQTQMHIQVQIKLTKNPSSALATSTLAHFQRLLDKTQIWIDLGWTGQIWLVLLRRVLCSVSVLVGGVVAKKRTVITMTVDTIDSVITIGAVVTSIAIVIATARGGRMMATKVVSFSWSVASVSSKAFSFVLIVKRQYCWGFYR